MEQSRIEAIITRQKEYFLTGATLPVKERKKHLQGCFMLWKKMKRNCYRH